MEDLTDIRVTLENHTTRLNSIEKDITKLSTIVESVQDLTISINKMAITMENMLKEQKELGCRVKSLEDIPASNWNTIRKTIITSVVSAIAGAAAVAIIMLIVKFKTL